MEQNKVWHVSNNDYFLQDITSTEGLLENGIYELRSTSMGALYLSKIASKFEFNFKVYGLEEEFITRALKTYHNTRGNFGLLFNGVKGTGKSVTAEILANKLNLPIILITKAFNDVNSYITSIPQDVVVFIDEYEKIYSATSWDEEEAESNGGSAHGNSSLLSLMDGVLKNKHRRTFILTTNKVWINENMLNRPGRLRYLKHFGDLSVEQVEEILDDCLEHKQWREEIYEYLKPLKIVTVDIVKAIISQVNIFNEAPERCCKDLNVEFKSETYNAIIVDKENKETVYMEDIPISQVTAFMHRIKVSPKTAQLVYRDSYLVGVGVVKDNLFTVIDQYQDSGAKFNIRFEKVRPYHSMFAF